MTIDDRKGHAFAPTTAIVEPGRLRFFNTAIGALGTSTAAPDIPDRVPIPPTYLFCLEMLDAANPFAFVEDLGLKITDILHAEQAFVYHTPAYAGDVLLFRGRLEDVYHKKSGQLTFLVQKIDVSNQDGVQVAEIGRTIVVPNKAHTDGQGARGEHGDGAP
ncbi:MaoC family dehydratase N-terminal domain-containing protein [Hephaestia sp. GCM10023244]|uniref:FAS1-like dehydratase domain-containing protein n=1 Tax=unclassified Hephaestia TaxID=2631281 RepID=UPI00207746AA|nr:MaoC family dehydratase N-terminal domain-containing protein [Hephaestia sp. MAHUQ-44]MCM8729798.1 MaoC family dehydratase N-terminal domain-containing protein [Hephaestia sp. MAHUQ-44]